MTGKERAAMVNNTLTKMHEIGVKVTSITCDGAASNQSMFTELGAVILPEQMQSYFYHPVNKNQKVYVILDVCHMLKLMRNTMASQVMINTNGEHIKWEFIEKLHKLQQDSNLQAGNKLRVAHIDWQRQKMKVSLAAQTLSASVADALKFCKVNSIEGFQGCDATIEFIQTIDHLFDILNSRNPRATNYKAPLRATNTSCWLPFLSKTRQYMKELTNSSGRPMTTTNRKTPFIGFMMAIDSLTALHSELVTCPTNMIHHQPLKYLLTYKFSQDHLEHFFGCVRSHGGSNNNPTARQFVGIYKRLLTHHEVKSINGNCLTLEDVPILTGTSCNNSQQTSRQPAISVIDNMLKYQIFPEPQHVDNSDYDDIPEITQLRLFTENTTTYIAGFVARNLSKRLNCTDCAAALLGDAANCKPSELIMIKNRGGLKIPSAGTIATCSAAEKCFNRMQNIKPPNCRGFSEIILLSVTEEVLSNTSAVFLELYFHMFDTEPYDNHIIQLVKNIAQEYIKIRLHHWGKQYTASLTEKKIRQDLTKQILF